MWQHSTPSNQTTPIHQHNSRVEDSPSDLPGLLVEETLEFQEEYPREVAEEEEEAVEEDSLLQHRPHKQLLIKGINLLATHHSFSQDVMTTLKKVSDFVFLLPFLFSLYQYPEPSGTLYATPDPSVMTHTPDHVV